jgi:hypothetical protein
MGMVVYEKPGFIKITHERDLNYLLYDWASFAVQLPDMKDLHLAAHKVIGDKKVKTILADTSLVKNVLYSDCIQWFGEVAMPKFNAAGLKSIITIVPKTALSMISTVNWQAVELGGIKLMNMHTRAEALGWIKSHPTGI